MEHEFIHTKTYRYEVINGTSGSKKVLFVLHGYSQLAKFFIRKFNNLPEDIMIVAPEGMHRFYLKGASGRVGASWMTKEAREIDISDNINWLDELAVRINSQYNIKQTALLGFSQGGATAARWNSLGKTKFDALVLWASVFPPDLEQDNNLKPTPSSWFVIGNEDEFYSTTQQNELISHYSKLGFNCSAYEGKHDIDENKLSELIQELF